MCKPEQPKNTQIRKANMKKKKHKYLNFVKYIARGSNYHVSKVIAMEKTSSTSIEFNLMNICTRYEDFGFCDKLEAK